MLIVPLDSNGMSVNFPDGWKVALTLHTVLFAKSTSPSSSERVSSKMCSRCCLGLFHVVTVGV
jgi:hypothetical protein